MAFHEGISSFFGSASSVFSSVNFGYVGMGLVVIALIVMIWIASRSSNTPPWREMWPLRNMGNFGAGGHLVSGRQMAKRLRAGAKMSFALAGQAGIAVSKTKLGKLVGNTVKDLFREEGFAISEEARLMNEAAASWNAAKLVEKLTNGEIKDHEYRIALDARIKQYIIELYSMAENVGVNGLSEQTKKFVLEIGEQLTTALVQLANSEKFEVQIRRQAFDATRKWLDICETSSKRAATVEARARRWEKRLTRLFRRQIRALAKALKQKLKDSERRASELEATLRKGAGTRFSMRQAIAKYEMTKSNVTMLTGFLEQLGQQSSRMVRTFNRVITDLGQAQQLFSAAHKLSNQMEKLEREVDDEGEKLKKYASTIQLRFPTMHDRPVDDIVLQLTADCAAVFESIIKMLNKISSIDGNILLSEVGTVQNAVEVSFKAEEATRIAEAYFQRMIESYGSLQKLVKSSDLAEQISAESLQYEINLDEMEEKIARGEETLAEDVKGFFIKTRNTLQDSKTAIERHIEILATLIELTTGTKKFILDSLERIITNLNQVKIAMNQEFQQAAAAFQEKFAQARSAQTLERIAA